MGIITRVRDVVNSNVNAALDAAENPEKLVKQMIREMEDTLVEIKASCAGALAAQKKAERELAQAETQRALWDARACSARRALVGLTPPPRERRPGVVCGRRCVAACRGVLPQDSALVAVRKVRPLNPQSLPLLDIGP